MIDKKILNINLSGVQDDTNLLEPGISAGVQDFNKIHVHEIDLRFEGSCTFQLKINNQVLVSRNINGASELNISEKDYFSTAPEGKLKISIDSDVIVTGRIWYSVQ